MMFNSLAGTAFRVAAVITRVCVIVAQPIRYLMAHVNHDYEEKNYFFGPAPEYDKSDWREKQFTLGLDFPNLPYYIDGDVKLTQSSAILRHLADKYNLNPKTKEEKRRVYEVEYQIDDLKWTLIRVVLDPDYDNAKEAFIKTLSEALKQYSEFLGKEKWLAGDVLTYVDFSFYESLKWLELIKPGCTNEYSNLKDYLVRFEALPNVSGYMKTDKFIKLPYFGPMAHVGNK